MKQTLVRAMSVSCGAEHADNIRQDHAVPARGQLRILGPRPDPPSHWGRAPGVQAGTADPSSLQGAGRAADRFLGPRPGVHHLSCPGSSVLLGAAPRGSVRSGGCSSPDRPAWSSSGYRPVLGAAPQSAVSLGPRPGVSHPFCPGSSVLLGAAPRGIGLSSCDSSPDSPAWSSSGYGAGLGARPELPPASLTLGPSQGPVDAAFGIPDGRPRRPRPVRSSYRLSPGCSRRTSRASSSNKGLQLSLMGMALLGSCWGVSSRRRRASSTCTRSSRAWSSAGLPAALFERQLMNAVFWACDAGGS